jgi:hypothetical protein
MRPLSGSLFMLGMTAAHTAASNVNINLEALFGPHVSSGTLIASASDANFSSVVGPRWSSWQPPQYFGAIKPANEADLQAIVSAGTVMLSLILILLLLTHSHFPKNRSRLPRHTMCRSTPRRAAMAPTCNMARSKMR